jgi:hypothetical protein
MLNNSHKIGAAFYVLWGVFHVIIGIVLFQQLFTVGSYGVMATTGSAVPASQIPHLDVPVLNGILGQYAWNILWPGVFAIVVAVLMNWKNDPIGYWSNLIVITLVDSGFLVAIVLPGYISMRDGLPGPIFWILAVIFSTIGYRRQLQTSTMRSHPSQRLSPSV